MDDQTDWTADMVREHYNPPPPTPREEIWARLEERLGREGVAVSSESEGEDRVIPLSRRPRRMQPAWLALAATAVLAAGVGIGRWSRTPAEGPARPDTTGEVAVALDPAGIVRANRAAAVEHLSRSEPLLTLVKADVTRGAVDREVGDWARELLGQTRFLLDSGLPMDPEVVSLLRDLELVLLQASLVATGEVDGERARQEMELLREGLTERNVLSRIQAVIPTAGTDFRGS